jgi:hypothetical protein
MVTANSPRVSLGNNLLAALPEHEYQRLLPDLQRVELTCGQVLYEPGEEIQYIYFPLNSVICLMTLMEDGSNIGVDIIGKEGMVGLPLFLGSNTAPNQALVAISGSAIRVVWNFIRYLRQFFKLRRRDPRDAGCVAFDSMISEPLSAKSSRSRVKDYISARESQPLDFADAIRRARRDSFDGERRVYRSRSCKY